MLLIDPFHYPEDKIGEGQPDQGVEEQGQLVSVPRPPNLVALELQELGAIGNTVECVCGLIKHYGKHTAGRNKSH